jgi:glycolate oxidase FAD binding subunit
MLDKDCTTEFIGAIHTAAAAKAGLRIQGQDTKSFLGEPGSATQVISTKDHRGILNYEPTELVITARSGTPLFEIEQALSYKRQMLGFEPPHFGRATLGGAVGAGLSGPRRAAAGACRDFVLGARILNDQGQSLSFGGEVMKNVAGYDVSRLLAGSFGTLGLITELSIKVVPMPAASLTLVLDATQEQALTWMNQWGGQALPVSATSWVDHQLVVRLEGARAAVASAASKLGGAELSDLQSGQFWKALREHQHGFFNQANTLLRLSLPSTCPALNLPGKQWLEWGGALRWLAIGEQSTEESQSQLLAIRQQIEAAGGHASVYRGPPSLSPRFHPLNAGLNKLHQALKRQFDPSGLFCPGRLYGNL